MNIITYCADRGAIGAVPACRAVSSGVGISWPLAVHSLCTGQASQVVLHSGQVIESPCRTGILMWVSGVQWAVVTPWTQERWIVWSVGIAVVTKRAALTGLLIGQILVRSCWTSNGILCTFWAIVTGGTLVTYDGVDGSRWTLTVIEHQRVGLIHPWHTVVAIHTHSGGHGQVHT